MYYILHRRHIWITLFAWVEINTKIRRLKFNTKAPMCSWNLVVHLGKQNRAALFWFSCKEKVNFTKTGARVTTVHHLHNNEAVRLPVDNMTRCLLSPYLYPLLGLGRCYFLQQYPSEETEDFITQSLNRQIYCIQYISYNISYWVY